MSIIYTIIIPHHNIPELLDRCLRSIPKRDDVQVVVVDDCSDIKYQQRVKEIEHSHRHVQFVYNGISGGGGKARNTGLLYAKGKYILFADADDFFNDCINDILDDYKTVDVDLVFFKGNSVDTDTFIPAYRADHLNYFVDEYLNGKDAVGNFLRYKFGEPWARMVKASVIFDNDIRFDETLIHNDTTYAYLVGYYGKTMKVDDRPLYCVTVRLGSVSVSIDNERIKTRISVFSREEIFFKEHNIPMEVTEHYVQLARLLAHRNFSLFKECCCIISNFGNSLFVVYCRAFKTFLHVSFNKAKALF